MGSFRALGKKSRGFPKKMGNPDPRRRTPKARGDHAAFGA
jgi:hypothetical protein